MGNLKQKYTEEEWEALASKSFSKEKRDYIVEWNYEASLDLGVIEDTHGYYLDTDNESPYDIRQELIRLDKPSIEYMLGYVEALKKLKQTKSVYFNEVR